MTDDIHRVEEDKSLLIEQQGILEKQIASCKREIMTLKEQLDVQEAANSAISRQKDQLQSEIQSLKETIKSDVSKLEDRKVDEQSYEKTLEKKKEREYEMLILQLKKELLNAQQESEIRLNLIKELTAANQRLEDEFKETSFLLDEKFDFDEQESTITYEKESPVSVKHSIFGELADEIHSKLSIRYEEEKELTEAALNKELDEIFQIVQRFFSRLSETDLATINRNLKQAFDTSKIVHLANAIVENILCEVKETSENISSTPRTHLYFDLLIYLCNQKILLNEYIRLYTEKSDIITKKLQSSRRRTKKRSFFSFLIPSSFRK